VHCDESVTNALLITLIAKCYAGFVQINVKKNFDGQLAGLLEFSCHRLQAFFNRIILNKRQRARSKKQTEAI
jgi:hypothetical protein